MVEIESGLCNLQMADNESICFTTSKSSIPRERREMVRPLARKDIFYSGSVMNLPEFKSQKSLTSYRQSVISLPKYAQERGDVVDMEKGSKLQKTHRLQLHIYDTSVCQQLAYSLACESSGESYCGPAEGANVPAAVSFLLLKVKACVITSVHRCYAICPLMTCICIYVMHFSSLNMQNCMVSCLRRKHRTFCGP
jgi:hypothetical protein